MARSLDLLDEALGVPQWEPKGRVHRSGALRWQYFKALGEPTATEFVNEVERRMADPRARYVKMVFDGPDGRIGRTVNRIPRRPMLDYPEGRLKGTAREQMEKWLAGESLESEATGGSDPLEADYRPITDEMLVGWVEPRVAGAGGTSSYKAAATHLYTMRDYKCAEGDCAFAAVRAVAPKTAKKNKSIRRELGLSDGAISLEELEPLARYFGVGISVYIEATEVEEVFDDATENRFVGKHKHKRVWEVLPREGEKVANLYYHANHYSHITEFKEIPASSWCPVTGDYKADYTRKQLQRRVEDQGRHYRKPKAAPKAAPKAMKSRAMKTRVLVFDFETVWDPEEFDRLRPYSVAWLEFDPKAEPISAALEPQVKFAFGLDTCADSLLDYVQEAPPDVRYILAGFNSARFDNYLLARAAQRREMLTRVFATGNSIRNLWMGRHESLDIAKLCPGASLMQCCTNFKTDPVKVDGFNHNVVQKEFLAGRLEAWATANREQLEHYVKCDVLSTASLLVKLQGALKELINVDVLEGQAQTIGGAAWLAYERSAKAEGRVKYPASTAEMDAFFREAIVGGRVQNFKPSNHRERGRIRMVDVASLYPTVMYGKNKHLMPEELLYGLYPKGTPVATSCYMPGKIGFYRVKVKRQPPRNVLPKRLEDGRLDWRFAGEFETVASQCSIELIRRYGGEVEVGEGYFFQGKDDRAFATFLEPIFAAKDEEDRLAAAKDPSANPSRRNMAKLLMNSLSGKNAQRNFDERVVLAKGSAQQLGEEAKMRGGLAMWIPLCGETAILVGRKPEDKVYNRVKAKPSYMAALIYEYSRAYMYELMLSKYDVQYMDTDSAVMTGPEYERFRADYPELDFQSAKRPKMLGDLEEELGHPEDAEAILLGPKEYMIHDHKTGKSKARLKGVNLGRDKLVPAGLKLPKGSCELYALHESLPLATPLALFEGLASGTKQRLLCSQIQRSLVSTEGLAFTLRQRFLAKELEPRKAHDEAVPVMRNAVYRL